VTTKYCVNTETGFSIRLANTPGLVFILEMIQANQNMQSMDATHCPATNTKPKRKLSLRAGGRDFSAQDAGKARQGGSVIAQR
jgi:hypothetical protein